MIVGNFRECNTFDQKAIKYNIPRLNAKFLDDCINSGTLIQDITPYFNNTTVFDPIDKINIKKRKFVDLDKTEEKIVLTNEQKKQFYDIITNLDKTSAVDIIFALMQRISNSSK